MEGTLLKRLTKLHVDPHRCAEEYRATQEGFHGQEGFQKALQFLSALADPHRLAMVKLLQRYGEMCACDIEAAFDLAHSTVIYHLNLLAEAGIVEVHKDGKWSYYRISRTVPSRLQEVVKFIGTLPDKAIRWCCCHPRTGRGLTAQ